MISIVTFELAVPNDEIKRNSFALFNLQQTLYVRSNNLGAPGTISYMWFQKQQPNISLPS